MKLVSVEWPRNLACCGLVMMASVALLVVGCSGEENRNPTAAEGAAADAKRQAAIDAMPNITPETKAMMKAKMGGPAVAMPGDDIKAKAGKTGASNAPTR